MRTNPLTKTGRRLMAALSVGLLIAPAARADDLAQRIQQLEARLAASQQTIDKLSARVTELERALVRQPAAPLPAASAPAVAPAVKPAEPVVAAAAPAASAPTDQEPAIPAPDTSGHPTSEGYAGRDPEAGLPLHGFADVGAAWSTSEDPLRLRGFHAGSLDIYLTPQLGDRVKALFELVLENLPDGEHEFEAERLQLGYIANDSLTLWMGRFHNPIGLWNTLYHHGAYLQTSIARPRFIDFEDKGGIIPTHTVGVWGTGRVATDAGRLNYDLYVGNGPTIRDRSLDVNLSNDDTANKSVGFNVGLVPGGSLTGWTFGVHGMGSDVQARSSTGTLLSTTRVRLGGAYFEYERDPWNVLGEYYYQRDRDEASSMTTSNNLWFVQASRSFGAFVPYLRYERAALDTADLYFRSLLYGRPYQRAVFGLRYEVNPRSALKAEWAETREYSILQIDETGAVVPFPAVRYRGLAIQYSIAF